MVADMGFKTMLTEGAKHILGWKSPNYVYTNAINPKLKLLLKNFQLSDDIAFRFSERAWNEWPLTVDKYVGWLNQIEQEEQVINLFMDYETFGEHQWAETGIFDFMRALPAEVFRHSDFEFNTPAEVSKKFQPVAKLHVPYPISWADEERDLTAWLGNELQDEAFDKLYALEKDVKRCGEFSVLKDWEYLQTSDHFYYMCTKWFSDGDVHKYFNPYGSPYDAFINFMNVLSDFELCIKDCIKVSGKNLPEEFNDYLPEEYKEYLTAKGEKVNKKRPGNKRGKGNSVKDSKTTGYVLIESLNNLTERDLKNFLNKFDKETILCSFYNSSDELKNKVKKVVNKQLATRLDKFNPKKSKLSKKVIDNSKQRMRYHIKKLL
jgi:alpha-amylase/alpha-mannosidase (GH57 family)